MSEHTCAIVGAKFRPPALGILNSLCSGFPLLLRREPSNLHDSNAIQVICADRDHFSELDEQFVEEKLAGYGYTRDDVLARLPFQIGYIPRDDAEIIAQIADRAGIVQWRGVLLFSAQSLPRVRFTLDATQDKKEDE